MTVDTSSEAVERSAGFLEQSHFGALVHNEVALLRALAKERDEWKERAEMAETRIDELDEKTGDLKSLCERMVVYVAAADTPISSRVLRDYAGAVGEQKAQPISIMRTNP